MIKQWDVEDAGEGFLDFIKKTDQRGSDKLQKSRQKLNKAIEEANKRVADEKGLTDSPLDDPLERIIKGEDPPVPTDKEMKKSFRTKAITKKIIRHHVSRGNDPVSC